MPQVEDQSNQAEQHTQETRSFLRQVRAATRRKYTPEEKIRIVLEGFRRETTVSDLCRREGIKPHSYYAWTKDYGLQSTPMMNRPLWRWFCTQSCQRRKPAPASEPSWLNQGTSKRLDFGVMGKVEVHLNAYVAAVVTAWTSRKATVSAYARVPYDPLSAPGPNLCGYSPDAYRP